MYCINCGKELPNDARFCPYCGIQINGNTLQVKDNIDYYSSIVPFVYDEVDACGDFYLQVKMNGKIGIMNTDAVIVIPCIYDSIEKISINLKEYCKVKLNNKYGIFDMRGTKVLSCQYADIAIYESLIYTQSDSGLSIYTLDFRKLSLSKCDDSNDEFIYAYPDDSRHKGVIRYRQEYIPCVYDSIKKIEYSTYILQKDSKFGIFHDGIVIAIEYDSIETYERDFIKAKKGRTYDIYDYSSCILLLTDVESIDVIDIDYNNSFNFRSPLGDYILYFDTALVTLAEKLGRSHYHYFPWMWYSRDDKRKKYNDKKY